MDTKKQTSKKEKDEIIKLYSSGELNKAKSKIKKFLEKFPSDPVLYNLLGAVLNEENNPDQAIINYKKALQIKPNYAAAHNNLGISLHKFDKSDEAIKSYMEAIKFNSNFAQAYNNLAVLYKEKNKFDEATLHCKKALEIKPDFPEAHNNLGTIFESTDKLNEAIICYQKAIKFRPNYPEAYNNIGVALKCLGQFDEAIINYQKAIKLRPYYPEAESNESFVRLLLGQFEIGWKKYEYRLKKKNKKLKHQSILLWNGKDSIKGKKILIWSEQGLGDCIQFSRFINKIIKTEAKITLEVQKNLQSLMALISDKINITTNVNPNDDFDFQIPLTSLASIYKINLQNMSSNNPYLTIPEELITKWSKKLGLQKKPRIGLAWSGDKNYKHDKYRSLKLKKILPIISKKFDFFCLQKDIRDEDMIDFNNSSIKYFGNQDFLNTGAIIKNLDLVISADTSILHLSGSLNFPTWGLINFSPDWRWIIGRNDTPWYPSVKLFRQNEISKWEKIVDQVKKELNSKIFKNNLQTE